jgi:phosphatidylserine/phosphatidylglycerophosphate/cardiolipin synthase-like enzyme
MAGEFQVTGNNNAALFTLKIHRGDGMALLAMNWKGGKPPDDFVGFAIEYKEPAGDRFFALKNRLSFPGPGGAVDPTRLSTLRSPIQKFRWVHFPRNAELPGEFVYRVTPVFMNDMDELSRGEPQEAPIELRRETYPGKLNVAFTRGFVSSQAFVDLFAPDKDSLSTLIPANADEGLDFVPSHLKAKEALTWMGFEARSAILEVLDQAVADKKAQVRVVAYDLCEPDVVSRLKKLGGRLNIIIDNSGAHKKEDSAESQAAKILIESAGAANVKRHHMSNLQHNKTIVVDGPKVQAVVCGSTNFTWRGFFVQANNAVILRGKKASKSFLAAFEDYWQNDSVKGFGKTVSANWTSLGLPAINAKVAFSPHGADNALLEKVAADIESTKSNLFYSLAFLYQPPGPIQDAIIKVSERKNSFVYGISDRKVGGRLSGLDLQIPDGKISPMRPAALTKNIPEPFKSEPTGLAGSVGNRMHHKFVVIDFDKPSARVYLGSYNFSSPADIKNGENLLLIRDRRIAVSYTIEALRLFDHYHFRVIQEEAKKAKKTLTLAKPPRNPGEEPWWAEDFTNPRKILDRKLFA